MVDIEEINKLTAEKVLLKAANEKSALHDLFEWDNTIAAERYRLQQARILINEVKIIVDTQEYYAFENVNIVVNKETNETARVYCARDRIMKDTDLREQIIQRAYNNILYWKRKYECYAEFKVIVDAIKSVEKIMEEQQRKKELVVKEKVHA